MAISLLQLPAELHKEVVGYLPNEDRLRLCLVSKLINARSAQCVYENIDLSVRTDGNAIGTLSERSKGKKSPLSETQEWGIFDEEGCCRRQLHFLFNIQCHPRRRSFVQTLKWTFIDLNTLSKLLRPPMLLEYEIDTLWHTLSAFVNATKVEISWSPRFRKVSVPKGLLLFPKETSLSMVGVVTISIANTVLNGSCANRLEHLKLDNFQFEIDDSVLAAALAFLHGSPRPNSQMKSLQIVESWPSLLDLENRYSGGYSKYIGLLGTFKDTLQVLTLCANKPRKGSVAFITNDFCEELVAHTWPKIRTVRILDVDLTDVARKTTP